MNWKAGDTALIVVEKKHDGAGVSGKTCVLLRYLGIPSIESRVWDVAWRVKVNGHDKPETTVATACLQKPYDGNEKTEWKHCVFQPKELVVTKALAITTWAF